MAASIPTTEPTSARAGDTWRWNRDLADYPAGNWSLTYSLFSAAAVYAIAATASGATHSVSVPGTTTGTYAPGRYDWVAHVSDGTDRYQIGAGSIRVLPNIAATTDAATLTTGAVAANTALTWTAATAGAAGNALSVTLIDPVANGAALAVSVSGGVSVRASLATGEAGAITTTADALRAAVVASSAASALVTVANAAGSSGAGIVSAMAATFLAGGRDAYSTYDGRSHPRKMLDAINAILEGRASSGELDLMRTAYGDRVAEWGVDQLMRLRQRYAAAVAAEDQAAALARGEPSGRFIGVRFT